MMGRREWGAGGGDIMGVETMEERIVGSWGVGCPSGILSAVLVYVWSSSGCGGGGHTG